MLHDRLKILRKEKKLTQSDVAIHLGVDQSTYAGYETRKSTPSPDKIVALADFYDVTADYILGRTKHKKAVVIEGDALPDELKGLDISYEIMRDVAASGLTEKQIRDALLKYKIYALEYDADRKK